MKFPNNKVETADKVDPYDAWKAAPTAGNMTKLLTHLEPAINTAITSHVRGNSSPVVRGRAKVLAMRAVKKYQPARGVPLSSYLLTQLQPLTRYSIQATQPIRLSERKSMQAKLLSDTERNFSDTHGRDPSDLELADLLSLSTKRIEKIRSFRNPSISTTASELSVAPIAHKYDPEKAWVEYVYHDLSNIDRKIFEYKSGRGGRRPINNIAIAKLMNMSPSAVSQRAAKIQAKISEMG